MCWYKSDRRTKLTWIIASNLLFSEFEDLATGVLNECYQRDKHTAHKLLTRSLDTWGGTTVFSMADTAEHMTLMGHSCCQTKLNKIWKGKMALYTAVWKVWKHFGLHKIGFISRFPRERTICQLKVPCKNVILPTLQPTNTT